MSPAPLLPPKGDPARGWALAAMFSFPFLFGALALFLGQDASWDFRNYHWYNAWAFVSGRYASGIDFMPSQGQFFFNPLLDVPFYWLASHVPPKTAYFILAFFQGLNFPLVFMICHATLSIGGTKKKAAACAGLAALGCLSAMGISEAGTQFNDNLVSLGILSSLLLVLRKIDFLLQSPARTAAVTAFIYAIPAGLAAGLKLTCISFCAGMCIALLAITPDARRCFILSFCFGLGLLAGLAAAYGHWAVYLASNYGSPMFPFFNILFRSPLLPPEAMLDYATPRNIMLPFFPFFFGFNPYLVNEIWWRDLRIPILYALFLGMTIYYFASGKRVAPDKFAPVPATRILLLTAGVAYYVWLFTQTVYRYLLPLDMLAPLLIVLCIGLMPLERKIRWRIALALLALIAVTISPGDWARRSEWTDKIADASPPALKKDAMVLMGGIDAYAYLVPSFNPAAPFVRIDSRGFPASAKTDLNELIRKKVDAHKGPYQLFVPGRRMKEMKKELGFFNMYIVKNSCKPFTDKLYEPALDRDAELGNSYPDKYQLCDVKKLF